MCCDRGWSPRYNKFKSLLAFIFWSMCLYIWGHLYVSASVSSSLKWEW